MGEGPTTQENPSYNVVSPRGGVTSPRGREGLSKVKG
jgi:hypothetical protein